MGSVVNGSWFGARCPHPPPGLPLEGGGNFFTAPALPHSQVLHFAQASNLSTTSPTSRLPRHIYHVCHVFICHVSRITSTTSPTFSSATSPARHIFRSTL